MDGINPLLLFALGVAASMLVIPLVWKVAPQVGLLDLPDLRKVHTAPVPRVGGWGITIGTLVPLLLSFQLNPLLQSFFLGALTLFVFGVWDDVKELGHWAKFGGQALAAGIVVFYGDLYVTRLPFLDSFALDAVSGRLFTMFALIGAINASNHSDGLDGLAGGEALLSLIAMAALAYVVGDSLVVGVALAAIGGILGFLRYNSHPARVFMGDSGSQVLGFTLGFLAVYLTQVAHTAMSAALPLLLLGLPIADILAVLYLRVRHGRNWFRATRNHVHHRLLDLGFAHYETVVIIYSIHAALVVSAVLLRYEADWLVTLVYFGVVGTLFTALHVAERRGVRRKPAEDRPRLPGVLERFAASELARYSSVSLLGALLLLATSSVSAVPRDFAFAGAGLAAVLLVDALRTRGGGSALTRAANYAAAILVAYLLAFHPAAALPVRLAVIAAIVVLTVAVAIHVRFSRRQEFGATPTDYLVVFGVLALLAFGSIAVDSHATVAFVAAAAALLYGCEVVNGHGAQTGRVLNAATFLAVSVLAFRGAL